MVLLVPGKVGPDLDRWTAPGQVDRTWTGVLHLQRGTKPGQVDRTCTGVPYLDRWTVPGHVDRTWAGVGLAVVHVSCVKCVFRGTIY